MTQTMLNAPGPVALMIWGSIFFPSPQTTSTNDPRRDVLVGILDKHVAAKGEAAVLYDLPRVSEACGTGLAR